MKHKQRILTFSNRLFVHALLFFPFYSTRWWSFLISVAHPFPLKKFILPQGHGHILFNVFPWSASVIGIVFARSRHPGQFMPDRFYFTCFPQQDPHESWAGIHRSVYPGKRCNVPEIRTYQLWINSHALSVYPRLTLYACRPGRLTSDSGILYIFTSPSSSGDFLRFSRYSYGGFQRKIQNPLFPLRN